MPLWLQATILATIVFIALILLYASQIRDASANRRISLTTETDRTSRATGQDHVIGVTYVPGIGRTSLVTVGAAR